MTLRTGFCTRSICYSLTNNARWCVRFFVPFVHFDVFCVLLECHSHYSVTKPKILPSSGMKAAWSTSRTWFLFPVFNRCLTPRVPDRAPNHSRLRLPISPPTMFPNRFPHLSSTRSPIVSRPVPPRHQTLQSHAIPDVPPGDPKKNPPAAGEAVRHRTAWRRRQRAYPW